VTKPLKLVGVAILAVVALDFSRTFVDSLLSDSGGTQKVDVSAAVAASEMVRTMESNSQYEWEAVNCHKYAKPELAIWECRATTVDPRCAGYVRFDVVKSNDVPHVRFAAIWEVQDQLRRCAPYGMFGPG
jgi:hypothetical protein